MISLRQALGIVVGIVGMVFAPQFATVWAKIGYAALIGAASGYVATGTMQGAVWGAFSAAAFAGIGAYFDSGGAGWAQAAEGSNGVFGGGLNAAGYGTKVLAHGITGGVMSKLQGGKFGHGFASAGVTQAFAPGIDRIDAGNTGVSAGRIAAAAIVGGTASKLSGGKFANGAVTGAFSRAFNDELQNRVGAAPQSYDPNDPDYHYYEVEGAICQMDSVCTPGSVALANRMHPAPGTFSNTTPIVDGQASLAQIGWGAKFDDFGPVIHTVSADGMTVRNITLPGHRLYPGYVERSVFVRNGSVYIRTIGEGTGPMGNLNVRGAVPMWNGLVNGHVRYRVNTGYRKP